MVDITFKMIDGREVTYSVDGYRPIRAGMKCLRKDGMVFSDVADVFMSGESISHAFLNGESVMHIFLMMIWYVQG